MLAATTQVRETDSDPWEEVCVHKNVLAAASEPIRAMLTGGMREAGSAEISFEQVPPWAMELIVQWAYLGRVQVPAEKLMELCAAADRLQDVTLRAAAAAQLVRASDACERAGRGARARVIHRGVCVSRWAAWQCQRAASCWSRRTTTT